jgi:hypothetical protein
MKTKFTFKLLLFLLFMTAGSYAWSEETVTLTPYTQDFEKGYTDPTLYTGWNRIVDSAGTVTFVSNRGTNAHSGTSCIGVAAHTSTLEDYIVSPQVKGNISVWVRRYDVTTGHDPQFRVYACTKNEDGTFTKGDLLKNMDTELAALTSVSNAEDWIECKISTESTDYRYVAIWMQYCYMDDFGADSAICPVLKQVTMSSWTNPDGYTDTPVQKEDGTVTVAAKFTVTNTGNVPILASDEENYFTLVNARANDDGIYEPINDEKIKLTKDIAVGESVTIEYIKDVLPPIDIFYLSNTTTGTADFAVGIKSNMPTNVTTIPTSKYYTVTPYYPAIYMTYYATEAATTATAIDSSKIVYFGQAETALSKTITIANKGGSNLVVTGVDGMDDITVSGVTFPITIAAGETQDITVTLNGTKSATYYGTLAVHTGENTIYRSQSYLYNGIRVDGTIIHYDQVGVGQYFESFEAEGTTLPSSWYNPTGGWTKYVSSRVPSIENLDEKYAKCVKTWTSKAEISTPKLNFNEGELFNFMATPNNTAGTSTRMLVSYSPDRVNWTKLCELVGTDALDKSEEKSFRLPTKSAEGFYGYNVAMPAGDYYIKFEAGNVYIDDIFGGRLADVNADFVPTSIEKSGTTCVVNNPLAISATYLNMLNAVEAKSYKVELYENGVLVAEGDNSNDIAVGASKAFDFTYTPNNAGEVTLKAILTVGESTFASNELAINVNEETASEERQLGTPNATCSYVPLRYATCNSKSEFIYTADELGAAGDIEKIAYPYYSTVADKNFTTNVKIWLQNTTDELVSSSKIFTDTDQMTLVYSNAETPEIPKAGSSNYKNGDYGKWELEFNQGAFKYTGGNLRVLIESTNNVGDDDKTRFKTMYFLSDSSKKRLALYQSNTTAASYPTSTVTSSTSYYPVTFFTFAKEYTPTTGTVKDSEGKAVAGAKVKAQYDIDELQKVVYEGETDENGAFSLNIYRNDLTEKPYTFTVSKDGYKTYTSTITSGAQDVAVTLETEASYIDLYVRGEQFGWDADNCTDANKFETTDGVTYTLKLDKLTGTFKIADNAWTEAYNFGGAEENPKITLGEEYQCYTNSSINLQLAIGTVNDATLTFNMESKKLTVTGTVPTTYVDLYVRGSQFGWNAENCTEANKFETTDGVTYTLKLDKLEGTFKIADNAWTEAYNFGGAEANPSITLGEEYQCYANSSINLQLADGTVTDATLTFNMDSKKLTVTGTPKVEYPETLYLIGNINYEGTKVNWDPTIGIALTKTEEGVFESEEVALHKVDGDYAYFSFVEKLSTSSSDWNSLGHRYGPATSNSLIDGLGSYDITESTNSYKIEASYLRMVVDLKTKKLSISYKVGVNALGVDDDELINVYNVAGILIRKGVKASEALEDLPEGIYIANGKKVVIRK